MFQQKPNFYQGGNLLKCVIGLILLFSLVGVKPTHEVLAQTETKVAVITDFGVAISDPHKAAIATLITDWEPDAVVTAGDNYHDRSPYCNSFAECVAGYNSYTAGYTDFVTSGNFFPAYGNHDAMHSSEYISYFSYLPDSPDSSHLYYDVVVGHIHFWVLNGNVNLSGSAQQSWLSTNAPLSTSTWNVVIVHQAPYGTGFYGDLAATQLPYQDYGIDFVISGHNHHYERLVKDGVRYFIAGRAGSTEEGRTCDGTGSAATVEFCAGTQSPALDNYGYMQIIATETNISFKFVDQIGTVRDTYSPTEVGEGVLGDVNGDGDVNSSDALIILSGDVGMNISAFCPMNCGDVNDDGMVNSTDALILLSYDVGITVAFPIGVDACPEEITQPMGCQP